WRARASSTACLRSATFADGDLLLFHVVPDRLDARLLRAVPCQGDQLDGGRRLQGLGRAEGLAGVDRGGGSWPRGPSVGDAGGGPASSKVAGDSRGPRGRRTEFSARTGRGRSGQAQCARSMRTLTTCNIGHHGARPRVLATRWAASKL